MVCIKSKQVTASAVLTSHLYIFQWQIYKQAANSNHYTVLTYCLRWRQASINIYSQLKCIFASVGISGSE